MGLPPASETAPMLGSQQPAQQPTYGYNATYYYQPPLACYVFQEPKSYLRTMFQLKTYIVMLYLLLDLPFTVFCTVWTLVTFTVSIALIPVFFIGFPLLYLFSFTWRALAKLDLKLKQNLASHPLHPSSYDSIKYPKIKAKRLKPNASRIRSQLASRFTWRAFMYLSLIKLFSSLFPIVLGYFVFFLSFSTMPLGVVFLFLLSGLAVHCGHLLHKIALSVLIRKKDSCGLPVTVSEPERELPTPPAAPQQQQQPVQPKTETPQYLPQTTVYSYNGLAHPQGVPLPEHQT